MSAKNLPAALREILFIHQSSDLYGSDRVLHALVRRLNAGNIRPVVLLPEPGPLFQALLADGVETHIVPVAKIMRSTLSPRGLLSLPFQLAASVRRVRGLMAGRRFCAVYSNTLAVLSGAVVARLSGLPHVWHVHEIMASPALAEKGFPALLRLFADRVICNSHRTKEWIVGRQPALADRAITVMNGVERGSPTDPSAVSRVRQTLGAESQGLLVVTLVGRINRMKGQLVLIEAAEILLARGYKQLRFAIVGSPPAGQEHYLEALESRLAASPARALVTVLGYHEDIWPVWDATDIAVVPSTEPESFGLVAVEAMAAGKPVVASSLGGLLDVVEPGVTGLLAEPGDPVALAAAIGALVDDEPRRLAMGRAGQERHAQCFQLARQLDELERHIDDIALR